MGTPTPVTTGRRRPTPHSGLNAASPVPRGDGFQPAAPRLHFFYEASLMQSMNRKLGQHARDEIRHAMRGLCGKQAKTEAERLAGLYGVTPNSIYNLTADIRPPRKKRADRGTRAVDLMNDEFLKYAASLVVEYNLAPADALLQAATRLQQKAPVELATFQKYLREHGLSGKQRRTNATPHTRFEAAAPGEMFQFDISGSKERWFDLETRKILTVSGLEISRNHENDKPNRVRIWRFSLLDDHSRRSFVRYFGVDKPNGSHVIEFLLEAYSELGVPRLLYTDNDAIIKFGRNARASKILNRILTDKGGYEVIHHLPGNARATGKVENSHKRVEQTERFIGLFLAEGRTLDLPTLNQFADEMNAAYNNRPHRTTLQPPLTRWQGTHSVVRKIPFELLRDALLADEFEAKIRGDVTVSHKGKVFQLPTGDNTPFRNWIGQKVTLIAPDSADFFFVVGRDGVEYEIARTLAAPQEAGAYSRAAASQGARNRKILKAHAKETAKTAREANKEAAQPQPILHFDTRHTAPEINVAAFPKPEIHVSPTQVAETVPVSTTAYQGRQLGFWEAIAFCQDGGDFANPATDAEKYWLETLCDGREGRIYQHELEAALDSRQRPTATNLRIVKSA